MENLFLRIKEINSPWRYSKVKFDLFLNSSCVEHGWVAPSGYCNVTPQPQKTVISSGGPRNCLFKYRFSHYGVCKFWALVILKIYTQCFIVTGIVFYDLIELPIHKMTQDKKVLHKYEILLLYHNHLIPVVLP